MNKALIFSLPLLVFSPTKKFKVVGKNTNYGGGAFLFSILLLVMAFSSCQKNKAAQDTKGYPKDVANIIVNQCATAGCHTDNSKDAAGGLSLSSWTTMFEGGSGGAITIPYRADQSWLSYFVNTYSDLGIQLTPTMPPGGTPLTHDQVVLLQKWINNGAPDEQGTIAFTGDPNRNKFYVTNQGCNMITVFDTKTLLAMRDINVGNAGNTVPHEIKVSPDGKYWYVVFISGNTIEKYSATDDSYIGSISIGPANSIELWSTLTFSPDGTKAFVVDFDDNGIVAYVDLQNMKLLKSYQGSGLFTFPHGSSATPDFKTFYVTAEYGNVLYKMDITDPLNAVITTLVIDSNQASVAHSTNSQDPHQVIVSPDGSKYFVSCENTNQVRVFQTSNDSLIKIIPVGTFPQDMAFSLTKPYLFLSCEEDPCSGVCLGSVEVINYNTLSVVARLQDELFQPHGVAVDDKNGIVVVASRNLLQTGPPPHHTSTCGGRNGFIRIIDLNTLNFLPGYRTEVSVDPYFVSIRNN